MPAASAATESSGIDETRDDLANLYKEYNELCDLCDAADVKHVAAVAAHMAVIAQHEVATIALNCVHTDTEQARAVLLGVQKQAAEQEDRCLQRLNDESACMQRIDARTAESDEHGARHQELQDALHGLEDSVVLLRDEKRGLQSEVDGLEVILQQNNTESCRQIVEAQMQLDVLRADVADFDMQYMAAAERMELQRTTLEATRLKQERSCNKQRVTRDQELNDFASTMAANKAQLEEILLETRQVQESYDEHHDALKEIVLSCRSRQDKHDAEIAATQHQLDDMYEQLATVHSTVSEKQIELKAVEEQLAAREVTTHRSENTQDADDAFESMLEFMSDNIATECGVRREDTRSSTVETQTPEADVERAALHAEVATLRAQCVLASTDLEEIQAHNRAAQTQTHELAAQLELTTQDLQTATEKLAVCRAEDTAVLESNNIAQAAVQQALLEQNELLLQMQSSIDFMGQNKQTLLHSIDALCTSRDEHASKLKQIHCYGNTVDLAMAGLRGSMHLRQSSPEFQIKIETVLYLFGNFLDWFEGTFTVVLYDFKCMLQNSRVD